MKAKAVRDLSLTAFLLKPLILGPCIILSFAESSAGIPGIPYLIQGFWLGAGLARFQMTTGYISTFSIKSSSPMGLPVLSCLRNISTVSSSSAFIRDTFQSSLTISNSAPQSTKITLPGLFDRALPGPRL